MDLKQENNQLALISDIDDYANIGYHINDLYNIPDEQGRVIINVGHPENEPDVFLGEDFVSVIKPHQIGGIRFLYDNIINRLGQFASSDSRGCILAHSMGLGKTLQITAFSDLFLTHTQFKTVLCIMPISVIHNWIAEFKKFVPQWKYKLYSILECQTALSKSKVVGEWEKSGGVLLIGYEMCKQLLKSKKEEALDNIKSALLDTDLVVFDEGHRLKSYDTDLTQTLKAIRCQRKIILTGYPIQNNLLEYWCMVDFVRPGYLGSILEFERLFKIPIEMGQCIDSTTERTKLMKERVFVLHRQLSIFVQRRSSDLLKHSLPPLHHNVILVKMTELQKQLYAKYKTVSLNTLSTFSMSMKIFNHPDILKTSKNVVDIEDEKYVDADASWASKLMRDYVPGSIKNSPKLQLLFCIITESINVADKIVIFSQSLSTLDIIEKYMKASSASNISWIKNWNYFRVDGSTQNKEREKFIREFHENPNILIILMSTKSCAMGINLTSANRVVIVDACWNPCYDMQAVSRVHRYGQLKPCFIYRLIMDSSIERNIYDRQINKQILASRVIDETNPRPHLTYKETTTLLTDKKSESNDLTKCENTFSDIVMHNILHNYSELVSSEPLDHQRFLVDHTQDQLSETEKMLALENYRLEKESHVLIASANQTETRDEHSGHGESTLLKSDDPRWIPAEVWNTRGCTTETIVLPKDILLSAGSRHISGQQKSGRQKSGDQNTEKQKSGQTKIRTNKNPDKQKYG